MDSGKQKYVAKTCPSATLTLSTINPTWIGLELSVDPLRSEAGD